MSITISKKGITARGSDASGLLIAMMADKTLLDWARHKRGSKEIQVMVKEAIAMRGLPMPEETSNP